MEPSGAVAPPVAETLPDAYRRVLDRVAALESAGHRREADLVRHDAIAVYSRRWNQGTCRRLEQLALRADRVIEGRELPRLRHRSRRAAAAYWFTSLNRHPQSSARAG